VVVELTGQ
jgi:translation initiation factor 4E